VQHYLPGDEKDFISVAHVGEDEIIWCPPPSSKRSYEAK
jgi:hypothetical protein